MSDFARAIVTLPASGTPITELLLEDQDGGIVAEQGTWKLTAPPKRARTSSSERPYGGQWTVGMAHDNASIGATFRVQGSGPADAAAKWEAFVAAVDSAGLRRHIEWRASSLPYPTFWEIRGPGTWDQTFSELQFAQAFSASYAAAWPVAPLGRMHKMDIDDLFGDMSLWTFDEGAT